MAQGQKRNTKDSGRLSLIAEGVTRRCDFRFLLIGLNAEALLKRIHDSDIHAALLEVAASAGSSWNDTVQEVTSESDSATEKLLGKNVRIAGGAEQERHSLASRSSLEGLHSNDVYVKLNDQEVSELARLRFTILEGWDNSLPNMGDEKDIRTTCYVFVYDHRSGSLAECRDTLETALVSMKHQYAALAKRYKGHRPPALRAVLLRHSDCLDEATLVVEDADVGDERTIFLNDFEQRILECTRSGPMRRVMRTCNLSDSEGMFDVMEGIAREIHNANANLFNKTTHWSSHIAVGHDKKSTCCEVQ
mmetsp:Transcript_21943/g.46647  ORF Transcript_21943/g.46647 Transcript_21943/m.46647 type:complete len:305 (-) Transcript_21943:270-1184(-)